MKWLTTIALLVCVFQTQAQEYKKDEILEVYSVEKKAEFPGGNAAMDAFIAKKIKIPSLAYEHAKSGVVIVQFVVEKDGRITNVEVVSKKKIGYGVEEAAIRVIKKMPKWSPATQQGKAVRMRFRKPIRVQFTN